MQMTLRDSAAALHICDSSRQRRAVLPGLFENECVRLKSGTLRCVVSGRLPHSRDGIQHLSPRVALRTYTTFHHCASR